MTDQPGPLHVVDRRSRWFGSYVARLASSARVGLAVAALFAIVVVTAIILEVPMHTLLLPGIAVACLVIVIVGVVHLVRDAGTSHRVAIFAGSLEESAGCVAVGVRVRRPRDQRRHLPRYAVLYADEAGLSLLAVEGDGAILREAMWAQLDTVEVLSRTTLFSPDSTYLRFVGRSDQFEDLEFGPIELNRNSPGPAKDPVVLAHRFAALVPA